jgi:hypothetical protein
MSCEVPRLFQAWQTIIEAFDLTVVQAHVEFEVFLNNNGHLGCKLKLGWTDGFEDFIDRMAIVMTRPLADQRNHGSTLARVYVKSSTYGLPIDALALTDQQLRRVVHGSLISENVAKKVLKDSHASKLMKRNFKLAKLKWNNIKGPYKINRIYKVKL